MKTQPVQRVLRHIALLTTIALLCGLSPAIHAQHSPERIDPSLIRVDAGPKGGQTVFGSGQYLTEPSTSTPAAIALAYVLRHLADLGLFAQDAAGLYIEKSHVTPDGVARVVLGQKVSDIRVHTAQLVATVDPQGRLVMVSGRLTSAKTSGRSLLSGWGCDRSLGQPRRRAPRDLPVQAATRAAGRHSFPNPYARGLLHPEPVSAELVWFMMGNRAAACAGSPTSRWIGESGMPPSSTPRPEGAERDDPLLVTPGRKAPSSRCQNPDIAGATPVRRSLSRKSAAPGSAATPRAAITSTPTAI